MNSDIKVSVCVVTYNQEKYIAECLQSIVDQVVDFNIEIIVADDGSTDKTSQIIGDFSTRYSELIVPILHNENIGVEKNYRSAHDLARGEYVAHCDGDDVWLPGKLAYQIDLLDRNPQASQCWTCARLIDDEGNKIGVFPSRLARLLYPKVITAKDIATSYALVGQHSTQVYRRKYKFNFDSGDSTLDYWIAFNISLNGPALYSKKILSGYRMTSMPSVTRNRSNKRVSVDLLAKHLSKIICTYPNYSKSAKANVVARRFLSKIRGHDLDVIDRNINMHRDDEMSYFDFCKSVYYFILQKI